MVVAYASGVLLLVVDSEYGKNVRGNFGCGLFVERSTRYVRST